jgi:HD-like signal output (HDOD) protein
MTQSTGPSTNILELVNGTIELPTMPEVLAKLNEVIAKPDASAADVALVVANDPAVATNMLRIVNSAYYGLQVRNPSVSLAIPKKGFNMTKKVALKALFSPSATPREDPALRSDGLLEHAVFTGVAARALASVSDVQDIHSEDVYIGVAARHRQDPADGEGSAALPRDAEEVSAAAAPGPRSS